MIDAEVLKVLQRAEEMHVYVNNQIAGKHASSERLEMFARFLSMMISHHESILTLIRNDRLAGSALALFRPLIETGFRGHFAAFLASDAQIQQIKLGDEPYPHFNDMATSLDEIFGTNGLFSQYKGATWQALCGFTHCGLEQLSRRVHADGSMGAHYEPSLICDLINSSTSALILTTIPFMKLADWDDAAEAVSNRYIALYQVLSAT